MKVYTKKGDLGKTSLIGGKRVDKDHIRIEAYGTVDELNSYIGLVRDLLGEEHELFLISIQNNLFTLGSLLANESSKMKLPELNKEHVLSIENEIDKLDQELPPMRNFVLPGGHVAISTIHIARCICRRAERKCITLQRELEISGIIIAFLNRLSDYLFVLARKKTLDLKVKETPWIPKK